MSCILCQQTLRGELGSQWETSGNSGQYRDAQDVVERKKVITTFFKVIEEQPEICYI